MACGIEIILCERDKWMVGWIYERWNLLSYHNVGDSEMALTRERRSDLEQRKMSNQSHTQIINPNHTLKLTKEIGRAGGDAWADGSAVGVWTWSWGHREGGWI